MRQVAPCSVVRATATALESREAFVAPDIGSTVNIESCNLNQSRPVMQVIAVGCCAASIAPRYDKHDHLLCYLTEPDGHRDLVAYGVRAGGGAMSCFPPFSAVSGPRTFLFASPALKFSASNSTFVFWVLAPLSPKRSVSTQTCRELEAERAGPGQSPPGHRAAALPPPPDFSLALVPAR